MKLQTVTFEQAQALKELGFPQNETSTCYDNTGQIHYTSCMDTWLDNNLIYYCRPSLELVAKWFRDTQRIYVYVRPHMTITYAKTKQDVVESVKYEVGVEEIDDNDVCNIALISNLSETYEEAMSEGIDKEIEILKARQSKK